MKDSSGLEDLEKLNLGQVSGVVYKHFRGFIDQQKELTFKRLMSEFRSGNIEHIKLVCLLSEVKCLEDLEKTLVHNISKAQKIRGDVFNVTK